MLARHVHYKLSITLTKIYLVTAYQEINYTLLV